MKMKMFQGAETELLTENVTFRQRTWSNKRCLMTQHHK